VFFREPPFQIGPGINAGRRVSLKVHQVSGARFISGMEKVVEPDFIQRGARSKRRDMPADSILFPIGAHHHRHSVPADDALDSPFNFPVARKPRLLIDVYGIDVRRGRAERQRYPAAVRLLLKQHEQLADALGASAVQNIFQRLQPLFDFGGILPGGHTFNDIWRHTKKLLVQAVLINFCFTAEPAVAQNAAAASGSGGSRAV
jgi:hypothetical protein